LFSSSSSWSTTMTQQQHSLSQGLNSIQHESEDVVLGHFETIRLALTNLGLLSRLDRTSIPNSFQGPEGPSEDTEGGPTLQLLKAGPTLSTMLNTLDSQADQNSYYAALLYRKGNQCCENQWCANITPTGSSATYSGSEYAFTVFASELRAAVSVRGQPGIIFHVPSQSNMHLHKKRSVVRDCGVRVVWSDDPTDLLPHVLESNPCEVVRSQNEQSHTQTSSYGLQKKKKAWMVPYCLYSYLAPTRCCLSCKMLC